VHYTQLQCHPCRKAAAARLEEDEDPDLVSLVLSPVVAGFNKAFTASAGVAKRVLSALSIENIKDGLKCFLYEKYVAYMQQQAMVAKLKGFGTSAAHTILDHLAVRPSCLWVEDRDHQGIL
jgi:hypothetical protein